MVDESQSVRIERFIVKLEQIEQDAARRDTRAAAQSREWETTRRKLEEIVRESGQLRLKVDEFSLVINEVAAGQRQRIADTAAAERLTRRIAKWLQVGIGSVVLVVTLWTGGVRATLDYLSQLLREVK